MYHTFYNNKFTQLTVDIQVMEKEKERFNLNRIKYLTNTTNRIFDPMTDESNFKLDADICMTVVHLETAWDSNEKVTGSDCLLNIIIF